MDLSTIIATCSLLLSIVSLVWIGGFRFAALIHEVKGLKETIQKVETRMETRFEKVEGKIDNIIIELHKIDVRVSILEKERRDRRETSAR